MTGRTVLFFHAHPDDEALLTAGTMARLAHEGHRVVLVTATEGEAGLAAPGAATGGGLGQRRQQELAEAARVLGCARVVQLGYPDSGWHDSARADGGCFAALPVDEPAERLRRVLDEEGADVLVGYDARGGYGHPDHVQVHRVARRAAVLAGTPALFEATVDRTALQRAMRLVSVVPGRGPRLAGRWDGVYTPREEITHCVDVRRFARQKRQAMAAHVTQAVAGPGAGSVRTLGWILRLPPPLFRVAFGREWFIEHGRRPAAHKLARIVPAAG